MPGVSLLAFFVCFFFNDTATTEIYTLSLHDALPICAHIKEKLNLKNARQVTRFAVQWLEGKPCHLARDRKSTRLNSSHVEISYAVFCLKKKKKRKSSSSEMLIVFIKTLTRL